jgi:hypothetical protein
MTNMADCIATGVKLDRLDPTRAAEATGLYEELLARYRTMKGVSEGQARVRAAKDLKEATRRAARSRHHMVVNQLQAMRRIANAIETSPDPALALRNLLQKSEGSGYTGESVQSLTEAYDDQTRFAIRAALEKVGLNVIGASRDKALLSELIRELHGDATGNPLAKALAEAVQAQKERLRTGLNGYGADIAKLSDHGVTHTHDPASLRKAGYDAWAARIEQLLDWSRIINNKTGKPFATQGTVPPRAWTDAFLRDVYKGITTGGWDARDPSMAMGGKALYNQRSDPRVLHFTSGQAWLDYNNDFGASDAFTALFGGLTRMAHDLALMRVLGPNPNSGLEFAAQVAMKRAELSGSASMVDAVRSAIPLAKSMLSLSNGSANIPENAAWASFFNGTRAVLVSAQLGSAVISSVTDAATITAAAQTLGMSATSIIGRSVKLMASQATRETAARMGYVAETMADAGGGTARYFGKMFGSGIPERMAGFTVRATGLSFVTDMRKVAFQMEFSGFLAEHAGMAFDQLPVQLRRRVFEDRGLTAADWDMLRDPAHRFRAPNGADFVSPIYWLHSMEQAGFPGTTREVAEGVAMRMQMAIREQLEYAIPTASLEGRARFMGATAPGSIPGELMRSAFTYKSFVVSLTLAQGRRIAAMRSYGQNPGMYAAKLSAMMIGLGAVAVQLKELAKGNDPRPMGNGAFAMAAILQGGGLGIFGDFFAATQNRIGGGLASTLAGPVVGFANNAIQPVSANVSALIKGDDTSWGRDAATFLGRNTPFLSSAWYARTAYNRLVVDELRAAWDPEADIALRRRMEQQAREYGTDPFISYRGSDEPSRLPNLMNAFGGSP